MAGEGRGADKQQRARDDELFHENSLFKKYLKSRAPLTSHPPNHR
jgi:hypothetical protein